MQKSVYSYEGNLCTFHHHSVVVNLETLMNYKLNLLKKEQFDFFCLLSIQILSIIYDVNDNHSSEDCLSMMNLLDQVHEVVESIEILSVKLAFLKGFAEKNLVSSIYENNSTLNQRKKWIENNEPIRERHKIIFMY